MRAFHRPLIATLAIACTALGACSSDKPIDKATTTTAAQASAGTTGGAGGAVTQPSAAPSGGSGDCAAGKEAFAGIIVNWQVVIGFSRIPTSEWSTTIGTLGQFADQIAAVRAVVGGDADAAASLDFMQGANDIVARGLGGDSTAGDDLAKYMGTDTSANINKQVPIAIAYDNAGC